MTYQKRAGTRTTCLVHSTSSAVSLPVGPYGHGSTVLQVSYCDCSFQLAKLADKRLAAMTARRCPYCFFSSFDLALLGWSLNKRMVNGIFMSKDEKRHKGNYGSVRSSLWGCSSNKLHDNQTQSIFKSFFSSQIILYSMYTYAKCSPSPPL